MKLTIVTGSRADWGLLEMPIKALEADPYFQGQILRIWGATFSNAYALAKASYEAERPDMVLLLGDRFEILAAATAAHLLRIPIAHIAGGDMSKGSYDDAMRDCISRMATIHFPTSRDAQQRLAGLGYTNIHWIGNLALDFIMHGDWRDIGTPAIAKPYVLVAYYPETIDDTVDLDAVRAAIGDRKFIWIKPNSDRGSERLPPEARWEFSRAQFLSVLANCDEFIGNSSAMFYEAPALGVKTRVIGKRQEGRVIPQGDGKASERIVRVLKEWGNASI